MHSSIRPASCDTMVALGTVTESGRTLLAKNSDRHPNEAQYLTYTPATSHSPTDEVHATYVNIPQVAHTYATIGSRPWWLWGFEHGVNEHGVGVGNEALWSKEEASAEPGLLGMDLLRLILERSASADEGLRILIELLERYGQSGTTNLVVDQTYHNGFLIADPSTAWVIETAGRHWAAKRVSTIATISNAYSIGTDYDLISDDAESYAAERGWWTSEGGDRFDFGTAYADAELDFLPSCTARLERSTQLMADNGARANVSVEDMWAVLRDVGDSNHNRRWYPGSDAESMICMHAQDTRGHETAASMVAELSSEPVMFASLASPRLSSFIPLWFGSEVHPWQQPETGDQSDEWWATERLQRLVERDYAALGGAPETLFDEADRRTLASVRALTTSAAASQRDAVTREALIRRRRIIDACTTLVSGLSDTLVDPLAVDPRGSYLADIEAIAMPTVRSFVPRFPRSPHHAGLEL